MLSSATYIGFNQFNKRQNLNANYEDVKNAIAEAKAKASSQIVENCTTTQILVGHQITFNSGDSSYSLEEVCSNFDGSNAYAKNVKTRYLPSDVSFKNSPGPILFEVLTGNVGTNATVTLTNGSQDKSISVSVNGIIN